MGTHPIFESDFDCLTEFILDRVLSLSLSYSICWLSSRHRGTITTAKGTSCCVDNAKEVNPATVMMAHAHKVAKPDGLGATARHPFVMMSLGENAGFCSGPNQCTCAKNYAQNSEDGGCHSMRVAGLKGAACALVVIITSITIC